MPGPTLVVMAAGMGSRYGGPKQIDPVGPGGELIIDYSIYDALRAGFGRVVFVIKADIEETFREKLGRKIERRLETLYVLQRVEDVPEGLAIPPERQKPWGTAHAVLSCRGVINSPFAVINADDFYGPSSYQTLCRYLRSAADREGRYDYCMIGFVLANTLTEHGQVARGVCTVDRDGYLLQIHERARIERCGGAVGYSEDGGGWTEIPGNSTVSMNMWGFTPSILAEMGDRFPRFLEANRNDLQRAEYFLPGVISDLIGEERARVKVLATHARWLGVTYLEDKPQVGRAIENLIRRGVYPEKLWSGGA